MKRENYQPTLRRAEDAAITSMALGELEVANGWLGDPARLKAFFEREGYLYFHDILDKAAVRHLKRQVMGVLAETGLVDLAIEEPIWTGKAPEGVEFDKFQALYAWRDFLERPEIAAVFEQIYGEPILSLNVFQYRTTLPGAATRGRVHQDGISLPGDYFHIAWIPLIDVGVEAGGVAVATGQNHRGLLHDVLSLPDGFPELPTRQIPADVWKRGRYLAGDLLLLHAFTPHIGLPNTSDRVRLSIDVRIAPLSTSFPARVPQTVRQSNEEAVGAVKALIAAQVPRERASELYIALRSLDIDVTDPAVAARALARLMA